MTTSDEGLATPIRDLMEDPNRKTIFMGGGVAVLTDGELFDVSQNDTFRAMGENIVIVAREVANEMRRPDAPGGDIAIRRHRWGSPSIADLRASDLGGIVTVKGLVKTASKPHPHYASATFQCLRCGAVHVVPQTGIRSLSQPLECFREDGGCGRGSGSTKFRRATPRGVMVGIDGTLTTLPEHVMPVVTDERWIEIQELPGETEAGASPATKLVRAVSARLADENILPGDVVTVDGVLLPDDEKNEKLAPNTYIEAHHIEVQAQVETEMDTVEMDRIKALAATDDPLMTVIVPSIAPNIVGHDDVKAALACHLFGGVERDLRTHRIRGTIHVMLLGDPGTAKSEMMRTICRISPRGFFTNAKGSTQVGLTAAAVQEREFGEGRWVLRAGPLVLADHGHVGIDEAGELKPEDFKALEEAMEQQTVTVSKAGLHHVLNARTAVLLAGNPTGGKKWDRTGELSIQDQVKIPPSTLSRIDLCYIILDDPANDEPALTRIAQYHGLGEMPPEPPLSERELRGYIDMARSFRPRLTKEAHIVFSRAMKEMRAIPDGPFTIRTYQGYLRLGAALARMRLSSEITEHDAKTAVRIHHAGWEPLIKEYYHRPAPEATNTPSQRERAVIIRDIIANTDDGITLSDLAAMALQRNRHLVNLLVCQTVDDLKARGDIYESEDKLRVV